MKTQLSLSFKS